MKYVHSYLNSTSASSVCSSVACMGGESPTDAEISAGRGLYPDCGKTEGLHSKRPALCGRASLCFLL